MKKLRQITENQERYNKAKALYDRPGSPGEKAAAKSAMTRIASGMKHPPIDTGPSDSPNGFYLYSKHKESGKSNYRGPYDSFHHADKASWKDDWKNNHINIVQKDSSKYGHWTNMSGSKIRERGYRHEFDPEASFIDPNKKSLSEMSDEKVELISTNVNKNKKLKTPLDKQDKLDSIEDVKDKNDD